MAYVVPVKSKVKISQNFVAFSEYMNFNIVFLQISYSVDDIFFTPLRNTPSPDEQCLRAQSLLHPVCAQTPEQGGAFDVGGPSKQVACHDIAHACSGNPECNNRLERYNQVRFFVF